MKAIPFVCLCFLLLSVFALPEVRRDNHMVFDDDPFGCDYFSCDDNEVLLPPRPDLAWLIEAWPGEAWPGLAWPGLAWPSVAQTHIKRCCYVAI